MRKLMAILAVTALMAGSAYAETIKIGISQIVAHPALDGVQKGIIETVNKCADADFEVQLAHGNPATANQIAIKFAGDKKDMVIGIATPTAQALVNVFKKSSPDTPVIFAAVTDPAGAKLVNSLEKPGGSVTGVSDLAPIKLQFELFFEMGINPKKVGIIYNSGEQNSRSQLELAKAAAKAKGVEIIARSVSNSSGVYSAAKSLVGKVDGIYVTTDNTVVSALESVVKVANENKIPLIMSDTDSADRGALAAKGFNYYKHGLQAGELICRVLKGAKPADVPVEFQNQLELVINLKTAKEIGLTIPAELLEKADRVIK